MTDASRDCSNCKWDFHGYCERPGGASCNWVEQLFRGEAPNWVHWEPRGLVADTAKPSVTLKVVITAV